MTYRPILFSAPMIRALLAGTKTQTRRVVKPQPPHHTVAVGRWQDPPGYDAAWWAFLREGAVQEDHPFGGAEIHGDPWRCPYGQPCDRLWVRETWAHDASSLEECRAKHEDIMGGGGQYGPYYRATEIAPDTLHWRPSIHMPRWASRITLEVTGVRVERLQDISEADALAEGIVPAGDGNGYQLADTTHYSGNPIDSYRSLWESINGPGSWDANPWVWAINFKPVTP